MKTPYTMSPPLKLLAFAVLSVASFATGAQAQLATPLAQWKFDGNLVNSGSIGASLNGTPRGGIATSPASDAYVSYAPKTGAGSSSLNLALPNPSGPQYGTFVDIAGAKNALSKDGYEKLTLTMWINLQDVAANPLADNDRMISWTGATGNGGFEMRFTSVGEAVNGAVSTKLTFAINGTSSTGNENQLTIHSNSTLNIEQGKWTFLAISFDSINKSVDFFAGQEDGPLQLIEHRTNASISKINHYANNIMTIGALPGNTANRTPPVWLNDMRIYEQALSEQDLRAVSGLIPEAGTTAALIGMAALAACILLRRHSKRD